MTPRELRFGQFWRDLRERSAYGATWFDRVKLMVAQVAYTLRWRLPWLAPGGVLTVNVQWEGRRMVAPLRLRSDDLICLEQVVMESEYSWPSGAPGTILDAGANCGYAAVAMARRYPAARLAVVEPEPENLRALRRTLELNQVEARVIGAALTLADGPVELQLSAVSGAHSVVPGLRSGGLGICTVPGRTVEGILAELGWERIGLLKIDVEGAEKALFGENCDWLARVDLVVGELHGDYDGPAVAAHLSRRGLTVQLRPENPRLFVAQRH